MISLTNANALLKLKTWYSFEFNKKKRTAYFVGQVNEVDPEYSEILVNFLGKKGLISIYQKDEGICFQKSFSQYQNIGHGDYPFDIDIKFPNVCI